MSVRPAHTITVKYMQLLERRRPLRSRPVLQGVHRTPGYRRIASRSPSQTVSRGALRRQFGSACFSCYVFGNVMGMMHAKSIPNFISKYIFQNAISCGCFVAWSCTILGMVVLTYSDFPIYTYMQCQCALGVLHMVIVQGQCVWLPAMGLIGTPEQVAPHPDNGKSQGELFKEKLHAALSANAGRIVDLFRQMDEDGDGTVNRMEFRNVDSLLGIGEIPDNIIDELFADWDPDCSGSIELDELNKLLRMDGLGAKDGL